MEFKNNVGSPGWLYGEQDFVAFEGLQDYIIVQTGLYADLQKNYAIPQNWLTPLAMLSTKATAGKTETSDLYDKEIGSTHNCSQKTKENMSHFYKYNAGNPEFLENIKTPAQAKKHRGGNAQRNDCPVGDKGSVPQ